MHFFVSRRGIIDCCYKCVLSRPILMSGARIRLPQGLLHTTLLICILSSQEVIPLSTPAQVFVLLMVNPRPSKCTYNYNVIKLFTRRRRIHAMQR